MDFGKLPSVDGLRLELPDDPPETTSFLRARPPSANPAFRVGSPRWADPGYVGTLYAPGTRPAGFLRAYAEQLSTIELNATWYRCEFGQNERWAEQTPAHFRFCPKLPQRISFDRRLRGCADDVREFAASVAAFGEKLGPSWILLPHDFGPAEFDALGHFLREWPRELCLAVELRHPGWFESGAARDDVFALLEQSGVGTVITDVAGRRDVLHMHVTAPFALVRLVGNDLHPSDFARADQWVDRLWTWMQAGLDEAHLFLHQPEEHRNVPMLVHVLQRFRERSGLDVKVPRLHDEPRQGTLF